MDTSHMHTGYQGVSQKHFFKRKLGRYPHVPLWGLYKAYPKAFFVWTSLEGQTTQSKIEDFYNVDFHSAYSRPGREWCDLLDLSSEKRFWICFPLTPEGYVRYRPNFFSEKVFLRNTLVFILYKSLYKQQSNATEVPSFLICAFAINVYQPHMIYSKFIP